jgi:hypothetical protein
VGGGERERERERERSAVKGDSDRRDRVEKALANVKIMSHSKIPRNGRACERKQFCVTINTSS